jgi:hypothetical protein
MYKSRKDALTLCCVLLLVAALCYACGLVPLYAVFGLLSLIPFAVVVWPVRCPRCEKSFEWHWGSPAKYCPHCGEKLEDEEDPS